MSTRPLIGHEKLAVQLFRSSSRTTTGGAVDRWLEYFQTDGRQNFELYLTRAGRYEPMMRAVLRDAGLPEDLVYMSLIESGFSPRAYSRARAVGLWQFMASTGRAYDLRISYWVDERRDPILATKAGRLG